MDAQVLVLIGHGSDQNVTIMNACAVFGQGGTATIARFAAHHQWVVRLRFAARPHPAVRRPFSLSLLLAVQRRHTREIERQNVLF